MTQREFTDRVLVLRRWTRFTRLLVFSNQLLLGAFLMCLVLGAWSHAWLVAGCHVITVVFERYADRHWRVQSAQLFREVHGEDGLFIIR